MGHRVSALEDILKDYHQVVLGASTQGAWTVACELKQGDCVVVASGRLAIPHLTPTLAADDLSASLEVSVRETETHTVEANAELSGRRTSLASPHIPPRPHRNVPVAWRASLALRELACPFGQPALPKLVG